MLRGAVTAQASQNTKSRWSCFMKRLLKNTCSSLFKQLLLMEEILLTTWDVWTPETNGLFKYLPYQLVFRISKNHQQYHWHHWHQVLVSTKRSSIHSSKLTKKNISILRSQSPKHTFLVRGFNPFEKYLSNWIISPNRGEREKMKPPTR